MGLLSDNLPDWLPDDPNQKAAMRAGLLNFGAALMGGRGNLGQILGGGLMSGSQGYAGSLAAQQAQALQQAQIGHYGLESQVLQSKIDEPMNMARIIGGGPAPVRAPTAASALASGMPMARSPSPTAAAPAPAPAIDASLDGAPPDAQPMAPPEAPQSAQPVATLPQLGQASPDSSPTLAANYRAIGDRLSNAGYPEKAKQYYDRAEKMLPKYATEFRPATGPDGKLHNYLVAEDGTFKDAGLGVKPDMVESDLGGKKVWSDKNTLTNGQSFDKSATPDAVMTNATTIRGQNMVDSRAKAGQDGPADSQFMRELASMYPKGSPEYDEALRQRINKEAGINAGGGGGRSVVYNGRIIASGNEVAQALRNIADLPVQSNSGFMGMGKPESTGLFSAGIAGLKNELNPDQVKTYNTMWTGVSRNLGTLETSGLATTGDLIKSIDKLQFVPGDNGYNALRKLAEVRQITEAALEPKLHDPAVPGQQREYIKGVIDAVHAAVPYTHADLTRYDRAAQKNPALTLQEFAAQTVNKGAKPVSALPQKGAAALTPAAPKKPASAHPDDIAQMLNKYGNP